MFQSEQMFSANSAVKWVLDNWLPTLGLILGGGGGGGGGGEIITFCVSNGLIRWLKHLFI